MTIDSNRTSRRRDPSRLLRDALAAKAFTAVGVGTVAVALTACGARIVAGVGHRSAPVVRSATVGPSVPPNRPTASTATTPVAAAAVHVSLLESDWATYGVGMPIVMRFTRTVRDARAFEQAVQVRVNGEPVAGAWYWERSGVGGYAVEAHYRLRTYWPAHALVTVDAPLRGLTAGSGLRFENNLTLSIRIGAAHISTVDASDTHPTLTVTSDGHVVGRPLPVSLGTAEHETYRGIKVVQEFDRFQNMGGTEVPWSVRLTNSGEFVHAAPWNSQIGRANLSHGCTNLTTADAEWFYHFSLLGDIVRYPNAPGPTVGASDGFGDWNVPWEQWRSGGLLAGG